MKRLLLVLIPLALVGGLLEVVLRTTHLFGARLAWTQPDRAIAWRFTPGREYWFFAENDHPVTGRINAMGWRDRERGMTKPPGTYRVAVLGDSFVEAFQVELDSTFVAIAERSLNARGGPHHEVMNFGRSGMSPAEEVITLERDVLPARPDAVVLFFTPHNDVEDASPATAPDDCRPFFVPRGDSLRLDVGFVARRDFRARSLIQPLKRHSALVSLAAERFNAARLARARGPRTEPGGLSRAQSLCTARPDSAFSENYTLCKRLIARMAERCRADGVRFFLASVPLAYLPEDVARARRADASFDAECFDRDLVAFARARGFAFIPLADAFARRAAAGRRLHWTHWNYAGHDLVGDRLAEALAVPEPGAGVQR
jgi:hypothetical protein